MLGRRGRAAVVAVATIAALGGPLAAGASAAPPPPPSPTVSVTPKSDLLDGQSVTVEATGFAPTTQVVIAECDESVPSIATCDVGSARFVTTDASGSISETYSAKRVITLSGQPPRDCAVAVCRLVVGDQAALVFAAEQISFRNVPLPPPLTLGVSVRKAVVAEQRGVARITINVRCSTPVPVFVDATLSQLDGRAIYRSSSDGGAACDRNVDLLLRFRPDNGLFAAGPAQIRLAIFGGDGGPGGAFLVRTLNITLTAVPN